MHTEGDEVHVDETEASGGEKSGHMRWVLGIGLLLAIGLLSLIWITGALSQGDVEEEATMSGEYASTAGAEEDDDGTDGVVTEAPDSMEPSE